MKVAVILANGCEELEALTPVDVLRRAGADVDLVSINGEFAKGSHDIVIKSDKLIEDVNLSEYACLVIPGGMPGATNISQNQKVVEGLKNALLENKLIASICASPAVVLARHGLIGDKKATCYNADVFVKELGKSYTGASVQVDGNLITANGPKSAMEFSIAICEKLSIVAKF